MNLRELRYEKWKSLSHNQCFLLMYLLNELLMPFRKQDYAKAIALFERANRLSQGKYADASMGLGVAYGADGKLEEAERYLNEALKQAPESPIATEQLALIYLKMKRYHEAEDWFRRAMKLAPRAATIYNNYALLKFELNKPEEGFKFLEHAFHLDPDYSVALWNLALFYHQQGNFEKAEFYLKRYRRIESQEQKAQCAI